MSSPPLVSIVIVAYKSRDEIGACVSSLPRALGERAIEIVVVDNSPGDGAGDIVQRDYPWVRYIPADENLGFGRANNLGFAVADAGSKFVLFLNPDTVCNSDAIAHCVERLQADERIGLVSPKLVLADGTMDLACRRSIPTLWDGFCRASGLAAAFPGGAIFAGYNLTYLPENDTYEVGAINGAFMMGRRKILERVAENRSGGVPGMAGPSNESGSEDARPGSRASADVQPAVRAQIFDERFFMYGDDLDLCIRVGRAGWKIVYDGRITITHLKGLSVAKDLGVMSRAIFDANRDVYLKHFNRNGSKLVRWKYVLTFGAWKMLAGLRARLRGYRRVRPL